VERGTITLIDECIGLVDQCLDRVVIQPIIEGNSVPMTSVHEHTGLDGIVHASQKQCAVRVTFQSQVRRLIHMTEKSEDVIIYLVNPCLMTVGGALAHPLARTQIGSQLFDQHDGFDLFWFDSLASE
jgi:hypothetical protein